MNPYLQAIILGIVQGIAEWLPISSSGHLVIMHELLNMDVPVVYDVMLHAGSLLVILIVFRKDIMEIIKGVLRRERKYIMLSLYLVLATIPIAVVGLFLNDFVESFFGSLRFVGFSLLFTSLILFLSRFPGKKEKHITLLNSILVGLAQAVAILPGVSRSGSTISAALMQGIRQEEAARFSFLLAIPAILGAVVLEADSLALVDNIGALLLGTIVSAVAGYFTLRFLLMIINKNRFSLFSLYCFIIGVLIILVS